MKQSGSNVFGKFKAGCLVVVLICVLIYVVLAVVQCAHNRSSGIPEVDKAPYAVQAAGGRVWFCLDGRVIDSGMRVVMDFDRIAGVYKLKAGESVILEGWYDSADDKKWKYHKGDSPVLNKDAFNEISIKRRAE